MYECEDCDGCEYKNKCTKAKGNKQIHVHDPSISLVDILF
ncbi:transposase [Clostridium sp. IBUN125C]